ncbi:hypothetical protein Bca4012_002148 [Brassica carinata]
MLKTVVDKIIVSVLKAKDSFHQGTTLSSRTGTLNLLIFSPKPLLTPGNGMQRNYQALILLSHGILAYHRHSRSPLNRPASLTQSGTRPRTEQGVAGIS